MRVSTDGAWIQMEATAQDGRATTALIHPDGSGYVEPALSDLTLNLGPGIWSPGGAQIAFEGYDETHPERNGIYIGPAGAGIRTPHHERAKRPHDFRLPSRRIKLTSSSKRTNGSEQRGDLCVAKGDGSDLHQLSLDPNTIWSDYWTGAPRHLVAGWEACRLRRFHHFRRWCRAERHLRRRRRDLRRQAHHGPGYWTLTADWSPDGQWIVFTRRPPTSVDLRGPSRWHRANAGRGEALGACCAIWSPDGTELLYAHGGDSRNLYVARADGSGFRPITTTAAEWNWYSWSP